MKRERIGPLGLLTYAFMSLLGVSLVAFFGPQGFEGTMGLGFALVGFLSGLLRAEKEEAIPYGGALALGANAIYLAVRLGDQGAVTLAILSAFFAMALFAGVLKARQESEETPAPKRERGK